MTDTYWQERWQTNQIGFHQPKFNPLLLQNFPSLDIKSGAVIFVPLCGKSLDMVWLADQGFKVVGVELSDLACKDFFKENNIPVEVTTTDVFTVYKSEHITIYSGDYFKLSTEQIGKIDAVYDRAALIALPDELRQQYASHLKDLVSPEAKMLLIVMSYNQDEMAGPPFSVDKNEVSKLYGSQFSIKQLYSNDVTQISDHLRVKGLTSFTDQVYCLVAQKVPNQGA
jgi:thiopurine S-methyltransferase